MAIVDFKKKMRRGLHVLFALLFCGNFRLVFFLLKQGGLEGASLGDLSSFLENIFLYQCAAKGSGKGCIVEIGSFKGRTTVCLALGSKDKNREKVFAIDPQEDLQRREVFLENIKRSRLEDRVVSLFKKSEDAIADFKEPVRLLFIDGCHEYEAVKRDILMWKGLLVEGGIIAMHDYFSFGFPNFLAGVNKAVNECIAGSDEFIVEGCCDSLFFASKKRSLNKHIFGRLRGIQKMRAFFKSLIDRTALKY